MALFRQVMDIALGDIHLESIYRNTFDSFSFAPKGVPCWNLITNAKKKSGVYLCARADGVSASEHSPEGIKKYIIWVGLAYWCSQSKTWKEIDKERRHKRRKITITAWDSSVGCLGRRVV